MPSHLLTCRHRALPIPARSLKNLHYGRLYPDLSSRRSVSLAQRAVRAMIATMDVTEEEEAGSDKQLSMVDEALVAGTIANTNGLLVILAKLVAKGVFD